MPSLPSPDDPVTQPVQRALRNGPVMVVDPCAIQNNFRHLDALASGTCAAVVKGDGYGHGMLEAARALVAAGAELFFTARLQDAISLRDDLGAGPRIAVLDGIARENLAEAARHDVIPVVNSLDQLQAVAASPYEHQRRFRVFLHLDTAMNRLGLGVHDDARARAMLDAVSVEGYMTHFASADDNDIGLCRRQVRALRQRTRTWPPAPLSIANSCGVFLGSGYHGEIVRPGKSLFGINPLADDPNPLKEAAIVLAPVIQVRTLKKGDPVGYANAWFAPDCRRIAILAIGYANGFMRNNSNRGEVAFNGRRVPVVGRVSMDLVAVDVTGLAEGSVSPGSAAEILGPTISYRRAARAIGTNEHEVLIALGRGCPRFYRQNVECPSDRVAAP